MINVSGNYRDITVNRILMSAFIVPETTIYTWPHPDVTIFYKVERPVNIRCMTGDRVNNIMRESCEKRFTRDS